VEADDFTSVDLMYDNEVSYLVDFLSAIGFDQGAVHILPSKMLTRAKKKIGGDIKALETFGIKYVNGGWVYYPHKLEFVKLTEQSIGKDRSLKHMVKIFD